MQNAQFSIGEAIEAMYEELLETYGDKELALAGAHAVADELLARFPDAADRRHQLVDAVRLGEMRELVA